MFLLLLISFTTAGLAAEQPNPESYPKVASKKGLQVQMVDDALALGIHHAALNCNLAGMLTRESNQLMRAWSDGRQTFYLNPRFFERLDRQVKPLSERGVIVSLILLAYQSPDSAINQALLDPDYDHKAPNKLGGFRLAEGDKSAYAYCLELLAERYSRPDKIHGRVWNYIVGNEVNSHWFWYNQGRTSMTNLAGSYLAAVKTCHQIVRRHLAQGRTFLSLEHHWNIRYPGGDDQQTFPGQLFLEHFNEEARRGGNFEWHLAFHPYPEKLHQPATWKDRSALPALDTPRITFKNLEVLPRFLSEPRFLFGGRQRRILLSEQGFHTPDDPEGEALQAAAYCYAWIKARDLPTVDAFILHRHVDHGHEGGLRLGLWSRDTNAASASVPLRQKKIYEVFRNADLPEWQKAFEFALPIIGITSWEEVSSFRR